MYAFSENDYVSAFFVFFSEVGSTSTVSEELFNRFQKFVCVLYENSKISSVNEMRYQMLLKEFEREKFTC